MSAIGRHVSLLSGYAVALPTPFDEAGNVDTNAFAGLCSTQIDLGSTGLLVGSVVGEGPTLTPVEHIALIRIAKAASRGRVPVIADTTSNSTSHAIELTRDAEAAGADAVLLACPYYNKPTQIGLLAHFKEIIKATGLPIFLHDLPSRTIVGLSDETVARLAELPQVIGLLDAAADIARPARLCPLVRDGFRLLSGDDSTAFGYLSMGGHGCISATSNLAPGLCRNMFLAFRHGQMSRAQYLAMQLTNLTAVLSREASPAPLKYALSQLGLMTPAVRLPLVMASDPLRSELRVIVTELLERSSDCVTGHQRRPQTSRTFNIV